ncbi:MAG TPA: nuclear transport factor 2 family protein, partial [Actinomycetota bacterium]
DGLGTLRHPEWVAEWPQSGERVPSHEADRKIHENYPGYPTHELTWAAGEDERRAQSPLLPVRVSGGGDLWVGEAVLTYPEGPQHAVAVLELRDGLVWRETVYWAAPFDPPPGRARLVEPVPSPGRARVVRGASPEEEAGRRAAYERFYAAVAAGTTREEHRAAYLAGMQELFTDDAVQEMPQSGELVRGLPNMTALVEGHPDFPEDGRILRITGAGDMVVVEGRLVYGRGVFFEVVVAQFRGDRVCRSTEYYAAPFEAPEWRSDLVEPM